MFGLNERAALFACIGQRGGRPAYEERGVAFACRSEPAPAQSARGDSLERGGQARIFAEAGLSARPGDRIELGGARYRIVEVRHMRGWAGEHHLEIIAREE